MMYRVTNIDNGQFSENEYRSAKEAKLSVNPHRSDMIVLNWNWSQRLNRYLSTSVSEYKGEA